MANYKSKFTGQEIDEGIKLGLESKIIKFQEVFQNGQVVEKYRNEEVLKQLQIRNDVHYVLYRYDGYATFVEDDFIQFSGFYAEEGAPKLVYILKIFLNWDYEIVSESIGNVSSYSPNLPQENIIIGRNGTNIDDSGISINDIQRRLDKPSKILSTQDMNNLLSSLVPNIYVGSIISIYNEDDLISDETPIAFFIVTYVSNLRVNLIPLGTYVYSNTNIVTKIEITISNNTFKLYRTDTSFNIDKSYLTIQLF